MFRFARMSSQSLSVLISYYDGRVAFVSLRLPVNADHLIFECLTWEAMTNFITVALSFSRRSAIFYFQERR